MKGVIKNIDELFKLIVESSYDGIYVTDGNANTIFLNQSYENITGINKKESNKDKTHTLPGEESVVVKE